MNPFEHTTIGYTQPGNVRFECPYITIVNPTLWWGGCSDGLLLPEQVQHVVQLYQHESYIVNHQLDSHLKFEFHDNVNQDLSNVEELADWVNARRQTGTVLVHCQAGMNRSGLIVARSLLKQLPEVKSMYIINYLREIRSPAALSNPHFLNYIKESK